ncbi:MAG: DsrS [Thioalkalispiraceae bacterium]|jgi:hypothetical protein
MQLSQQDSLRLNVLLNQSVEAIRIDDGKMIVYGLTEKGEAKIELNPNCKDEKYIKQVKEVISSHVLGSPGGYPVYLKRWTRMGQARTESLENLLKLGEPEAVVAVVGAQGITDEIARRAWWVMPNAENARRMLARREVANGEMGKTLAEFLIEFLPFEEEPRDIIESVRLVLQPGLIEDAAREKLWNIGQRKNAFLVGFLKSETTEIPQAVNDHPMLQEWQQPLQQLAETENQLAPVLLQVFQQQGQAWLKTAEQVLQKPANQDVVVALFEAIESYFKHIRPHEEKRRDINQITDEVSQLCTCEQDSLFQQDITVIKQTIPQIEPALKSLLTLSCVGEQLVAPVFAKTDSVGSVMRRKLEPISNPLAKHLNILLGK